MTKELVREKIARLHYGEYLDGLDIEDKARNVSFEHLEPEVRGYELHFADQILAIPEIRIEDPDQDLPECEYSYKGWTQYEESIHKKAQRGMLEPDNNGSVWVKVLKEKSNE